MGKKTAMATGLVAVFAIMAMVALISQSFANKATAEPHYVASTPNPAR